MWVSRSSICILCCLRIPTDNWNYSFVNWVANKTQLLRIQWLIFRKSYEYCLQTIVGCLLRLTDPEHVPACLYPSTLWYSPNLGLVRSTNSHSHTDQIVGGLLSPQQHRKLINIFRRGSTFSVPPQHSHPRYTWFAISAVSNIAICVVWSPLILWFDDWFLLLVLLYPLKSIIWSVRWFLLYQVIAVDTKNRSDLIRNYATNVILHYIGEAMSNTYYRAHISEEPVPKEANRLIFCRWRLPKLLNSRTSLFYEIPNSAKKIIERGTCPFNIIRSIANHMMMFSNLYSEYRLEKIDYRIERNERQ